jgi:hypothetical protein
MQHLKLKETLGEQDLKKLDAYVNQEFATSYPASLSHSESTLSRAYRLENSAMN